MLKGGLSDRQTQRAAAGDGLAEQEGGGERLKGKSANRDPGARADLMVRGFFQKYRCTFFDMKVAYPAAASYFDKEPAQLYKLLEDSKKREYRQRIAKVEDGDFVPMVMLSTGSMGPEMAMAVKRLCRMIAEKEKRDYAEIAAIARASLCACGAPGHAMFSPPIHLVMWIRRLRSWSCAKSLDLSCGCLVVVLGVVSCCRRVWCRWYGVTAMKLWWMDFSSFLFYG